VASRRKGFPLGHQIAKLPKDRFGLGRIAQRETSNQQRPVFGDEGAQRVPVLGRPMRCVAGCLDAQDRDLPGSYVHIEL